MDEGNEHGGCVEETLEEKEGPPGHGSGGERVHSERTRCSRAL